MDPSCSRSSGNRPDPRESNELPRKVNDHVYELYTPKEGPKAVKLEIIFFHGLYFGSNSEEAYLTTWTNDDNVLWPKTWLGDEFPQARILSVSYDASMKQTATTGRQDLYIIAENLTYDIGQAEVGQSPGSPVILVGHCFGGKQLCVQAARRCYVNKDEKMRKFLDNLGGAFFYATPHRGSSFPELLSKLLGGPLLEYVKSLNKHAARLDGDFLAVCRNRGDLQPVRMASVGEKNRTKILGKLDAVIVPEGSSRYENYLHTLDADHISICKPKSKTSNSFKLLSTFIQGVKFEKQLVIDPDDLQILTPKKSVGLDMKVEIIRERLEKAKIVGIVGMGGIGKTTLAMAAFNKFYQLFDFTCFVHEVKDVSGGFEAVMEKVSQHMCFKGRNISGRKSSGMNSSDMDWKGKQLLLVLDDIRNSHDTEVLSTLVHQAGLNSWFLVTCRTKGLLKEVEDISTYEMPGLMPLDAEKLFMNYALADQAKLPQDLDALAEEMVKKCDGLPLTLEILGKCLMGNNEKKFWVQMLDALQEADNISLRSYEKLWSKLRLSFDNLKYEEQQMFIDATTFFSNAKGMDFRTGERSKDYIFQKEYDGWHWKLSDAKAAWGVIYGKEEIRWQVLVDASLVYDVRDNEPIRIHEQLKSLGRKIADDDKRKRVWNAYEGRELLSDGLSDYQGIHSLRATFSGRGSSSPRESKRKREEEILEESCFNLKAVKYLENDYRHPPRVAARSFGASKSPVTFPADLIVLCSPTLSLGEATIDFTHRKPQMAVLILTDYSETVLPRSLVRLSSLKIFNLLAENLQELPDSFGKLQALEWVTIRYCYALSALPASFGNLRALKVLSILRCDILGSLPNDFGNLLALEELHIKSCGGLNTLPASFGNLSALEKLTIRDCNALSSLSDDFGNLLVLEELLIWDCKSLKTLPGSFGNLLVLEKLEISMCQGGLQCLPASFGNLVALKKLDIRCGDLKTLPASFGNLVALKKLDIRCGDLKTLPASFKNLCALKRLSIVSCEALGSLSDDFGNLLVLEELEIRILRGLKSLPASFGNLRALKTLTMECEVLNSLSDDFGSLPALEHLEILGCDGLETLPDSFGNLRALKVLDTFEWHGLRTLPASFGNLPALTVLTIWNCDGLQTLPASFGNLPALADLQIWNCDDLQTLPASFGNLPALTDLQIWNCYHLQALPASFGKLRALKVLSIDQCEVLASLSDDFGNLPALENLEITECDGLETLPDSFGNLRALKVLSLGTVGSSVVSPTTSGIYPHWRNCRSWVAQAAGCLCTLTHACRTAGNLSPPASGIYGP